METELGWKLLGSASLEGPLWAAAAITVPGPRRMLQAPHSVSPRAELAPAADS